VFSNLNGSVHPTAPESVEQWLKALRIEKYLSNFKTEEIDVMILPFINEAMLDKMGIIAAGSRMLILHEVKKLI
jgi:hypothetical protein